MKSHLPRILAALLTFVASTAASVRAEVPLQVVDTKAKTEVRIIADSTAISPGGTVRVGLLFKPEPGWHLYWLNPGDTGLPTRVTFEAPDGFAFGEIGWPSPLRFVDKLGGLSYGYEKEILVQAEVRAPDDLFQHTPEGTSVTIEAKASWLACKENCIQGTVRLGLPLPVREPESAGREGPDAPMFARYSGMVPVAAGPQWSVEFKPPAEPVRPGSSFEVQLFLKAVDGSAIAAISDAAATFIPRTDKGLVVRTVKPETADGGLRVTIAGEAMLESDPLTDRLDGVLAFMQGDKRVNLLVGTAIARAPGDAAAAVATTPTTPTSPGIGAASSAAVCEGVGPGSGPEDAISSFLLALLFAFVGGFILNAMPCVLPILSIKMLSLVEQSQERREVIWRHGLAYTGGVLASFLILAVLLVALKATNWAFQMQDPTFIAVFTSIVFAFALSLFGVFELSLPFASRIDEKVSNSHGYMSSFNYGIFAVLLGTPCTAPFLGPAMTYAFTQPPLELTLLLLTVGLGLAFPFLVLARFPAWRRLMPKPGAWLLTFKKAMAFLLVGTAVFLIHTLAFQVSRDALVGFLIFLSFLSLALWIYGNWTSPGRANKTRFIATFVSVGIVAVTANAFISTERPAPPSGAIMAGGIAWLDFDQVDVNALATGGRTVFIDFTAEWCTTCKVNENGAIYTDRVREALKALDVTSVKADFTVHKPAIAEWLTRFGQPSVPLYVVIPAGRPEDAFALSTILSIEDVVAGLCKGGASTAPTTASR